MLILNFLLVFCSVLVLLSILTFLYITYSKYIHNLSENINERILATHRDDMYDYLVNSNFHITLIPRERYLNGYENMLMNFTYLMTGEQVKANVKAYAEKYFTEYYRNMLKQQKWAYKVNAINAIVQFNMSTLTTEVKEMFHKKEIRSDLNLSSQILKILVIHDNKLFLQLFSQYKIDIAPFQYRQLCKLFNDKQWDYIINHFSKLHYDWQLSTIDCIGLFNIVRLEKFVEQFVAFELNIARETIKHELDLLLQEYEQVLILVPRSQAKSMKKRIDLKRHKLEVEINSLKLRLTKHNELIIKCLKTLATIGYTVDVNMLEPYLYSTIWQEKLMVIKIIGKVRMEEKTLFLIDSLSDQNFYVRKEALQSLVLIHGNNENIKQIYEELEHEYAKEVVAEYLEGCGIYV